MESEGSEFNNLLNAKVGTNEHIIKVIAEAGLTLMEVWNALCLNPWFVNNMDLTSLRNLSPGFDFKSLGGDSESGTDAIASKSEKYHEVLNNIVTSCELPENVVIDKLVELSLLNDVLLAEMNKDIQPDMS
ncbi:uncharacterized protein LOC119690273 [Teleopsis dalmanni]|uniref:uncharacterized protein LOC119690273 n=1 Tax=Teleopsis dalmanni TaxID=139649 RepID=UPI0018CDCBA4|nr:uncharacterized protein LOC119690273 [Teleopsis dalmanni]